MSLDKFLTGNSSKKKKKVSKPPTKDNDVIKKKSDNSDDLETPLKGEVAQGQVINTDKNTKINSVDSDTAIDETTGTEITNTKVESGNISSYNIFVSEFKDKSPEELFEIIVEIVHSSPLYPRNKNLLTKYILDNPNSEDNTEFLASQLDISYYEVLVIVNEIKNDFS